MTDHKRIILAKEKQQEMTEELKAYFLKEREEEIGDLAARLLLDFISEKLAPEYYNQGVYDAYRYLQERNEDLLALQIL